MPDAMLGRRSSPCALIGKLAIANRSGSVGGRLAVFDFEDVEVEAAELGDEGEA
jgi:hypothetical protein